MTPEGRIPAVPGRRRANGAGLVLTAAAEDAVRLDGEPLSGDAALSADGVPSLRSRLSAGESRRVVFRREGKRAVRACDPAAGVRRACAGIEAVP
ncbi:hypothetical protein [Streptomyces sp. NPDC048269]|uniref:hypothetical protein n=1 Tax=Streptomyces sp. NPDC048269 TaxID=3155753 RepID=UPI00341B47FC